MDNNDFLKDKRKRAPHTDKADRGPAKPKTGVRRDDTQRKPFSGGNERRSYNPNFTPDNQLRDASDKPRRDDGPRGDRSFGDRKPYGGKTRFGEGKPGYGSRDGKSGFGDKPRGDRKPFGDKSFGDRKPYGEKSFGDKPRYGDDKSRFGDKPRGDRKPFGDKAFGDKPRYGEDKPRHGEGKSGYGDNANAEGGERRSFSDKPRGDRKPYGEKSFGDRKPFGDRKSFGDKPRYGEDKPRGDRKSFGDDKPRFGDRKPFGDKPRYGDNVNAEGGERRSFSDKPRYGEDKPRFGEGKSGYGDKPRYSDDKPRGDRQQFGEKKPFGDRKPFGDKPRMGGKSKAKPTRVHGENVDGSYPSFTPPVQTGELRLNRYIAASGQCSRRDADLLIRDGHVTVNGAVVSEMGFKIAPGDVVELDGRVVDSEKKVYILMNKPKGFITSMEDPHAEKTVIDLLGSIVRERVYPVGRLDKNSLGVLLLTNDGDLTSLLTHPSHNKKKVYQVALDRALTQADIQQISDGLTLEDGPIHVDAIDYVSENRKEVGVEIHSGRNRIVRRIFEHLGYKVTKLDRVYFAGLTKRNLKRGQWRFLTQSEVDILRTGMYE